MPRITDLIRKSVLKDVPERVPPLEVLRRTERSSAFETLRMNRKVLGAMRYGLFGAAGKPPYDRVECAIRRLRQYKQDGNAEHLMDAANLAELEFVEGDGVVRATDDGHHTKEI